MASRKEMLKNRLGAIEKRIRDLEGGLLKRVAQVPQIIEGGNKSEDLPETAPNLIKEAEDAVEEKEQKMPSLLGALIPSSVETRLLADELHAPHHGTEDFEKVRAHIQQHFGHKSLSDDEKQKLIDEFLEESGEANFYTAAALLWLDTTEGSDIQSFRQSMQIILLPCFQILVPFGLCWFFLVQKELFEEHGFCPNDSSIIFRGVGFCAFVYSAWQIIDGDDDPSAEYFMKFSAHQFAMTGGRRALIAMLTFYACNLTQQICSFLILVATYIVFTSQSATPLDLLMNCVALNFVLGIDSEWLKDDTTTGAKMSAGNLFVAWRDLCIDNEAEVRSNMRKNIFVRTHAPRVMSFMKKTLSFFIPVVAYGLITVWTFCPAGL